MRYTACVRTIFVRKENGQRGAPAASCRAADILVGALSGEAWGPAAEEHLLVSACERVCFANKEDACDGPLDFTLARCRVHPRWHSG